VETNHVNDQGIRSNIYHYAGYIYDYATSQYYVNARYYLPEAGRFAAEDRLKVDGLNRYVYVRSNPLRFVDPSGYCSAEGMIQGDLTAEDYAIITEMVVARINEEAITTHWEFGVGIAGAIDTPIGNADVGVKLITFNGDFQGGENYAVLGEASLYGAVDVPGVGEAVKVGGYIRNVLPNHVSDGYVEKDIDLFRLTLLEKEMSKHGSFDLGAVEALSTEEQDILTNALNSLEIDGGAEAYLFIGFGTRAGINPGKTIQILQEEYTNYEK